MSTLIWMGPLKNYPYVYINMYTNYMIHRYGYYWYYIVFLLDPPAINVNTLLILYDTSLWLILILYCIRGYILYSHMHFFIARNTCWKWPIQTFVRKTQTIVHCVQHHPLLTSWQMLDDSYRIELKITQRRNGSRTVRQLFEPYWGIFSNWLKYAILSSKRRPAGVSRVAVTSKILLASS